LNVQTDAEGRQLPLTHTSPVGHGLVALQTSGTHWWLAMSQTSSKLSAAQSSSALQPATHTLLSQ
jgi:hypothetical protein